jgi:hypothetical protein
MHENEPNNINYSQATSDLYFQVRFFKLWMFKLFNKAHFQIFKNQCRLVYSVLPSVLPVFLCTPRSVTIKLMQKRTRFPWSSCKMGYSSFVHPKYPKIVENCKNSFRKTFWGPYHGFRLKYIKSIRNLMRIANLLVILITAQVELSLSYRSIYGVLPGIWVF